MLLSDDQKREIRQLMFVARHYLRLASGAMAEKHSSVTQASLAKGFPLEGDVVAEPLYERTIISADLASAAIRLASVEEVLERAGCGRSLYSECRRYFGSNSSSSDIDLRDCPQWFHILLRDVVGHAEPKKQPNHDTQQEKRYRAREAFIGEVTLGWVYSRLVHTADELVKLVKARGVQCVQLSRLPADEAPEDPRS